MLFPILPVLLGAVGLASAASTPILAYSSPKPFLGLESGTFDQSKNDGVVMFLPGFHACGTLQLLSVEGLHHTDFALLPFRNATAVEVGDPTGSGLKEAFAAAETKDLESDEDGNEREMLVWAKGWAKSCGKGAAMKEVRVAKVGVDWNGDREESVRQMDAAIAPHLASLPAPPHPHLVILTSFSPSVLLTLFDIATSTSHPKSPTTPSSPNKDPLEFPRRRRHGLFALIVGTFKTVFWLVVFTALGWGRGSSGRRGRGERRRRGGLGSAMMRSWIWRLT
ncbi:hypothetical protein BCR35DRAFT_301351, partial [Leucosporidium creatinivorum]